MKGGGEALAREKKPSFSDSQVSLPHKPPNVEEKDFRASRAHSSKEIVLRPFTSGPPEQPDPLHTAPHAYVLAPSVHAFPQFDIEGFETLTRRGGVGVALTFARYWVTGALGAVVALDTDERHAASTKAV
jgi:hypothetical protein